METIHFKNHELQCHCGCGENRMDPDFMEKLEVLREKVDFPMFLSSAYRCPSHNAEVSTSGKTGPHTQGKAVDVRISGDKAFELLKHALALGFHGVGISQTGAWAQRFIHLDMADDCPRPRVWTY